LEALVGEGAVDVVLSDDGLQHYPMPRDIELLVLDAERGWVTVDYCQRAPCANRPAASRVSTWYLSETAATLIAASVINLQAFRIWHPVGR
jgi:hypothetical protein